MESIKAYLGGIGNIYQQGINSIQFQVFSLHELANIIIPYFDLYPLLTQKRADFELFKMAIEIINNKEHLIKVYEKL